MLSFQAHEDNGLANKGRVAEVHVPFTSTDPIL